MTESIIIVEDNYDFGSILAESVKISFPDYNVEWFQTGGETARAIDSGLKPICGFIDTFLPDTRGINVLQYIMNSVPETKMIIITSHENQDHILEAFRYAAYDFLFKPFNMQHAREAIEAAIDRFKISKKKTLMLQDIRKMIKRGEKFEIDSLFSLVTTLEKTLFNMKDFSLAIAHMATRIGERLELDESQSETLRYAALLHDLGKVTQVASIVTKRRKGKNNLTMLPLFDRIFTATRSIYESYDGSGFPVQLKGKEIPISSRIISVALGFISLTAERIYQKPFSPAEALEEIKRFSGRQYDPQVVLALDEIISKNNI